MSAWEPMWSRVLDANPITDAIALDLDYRNDRYRALDNGILVEKPWSEIVNNYSAPAGRTYFDSSGVLQTAGANEMIRAFDPVTGEVVGNQVWNAYTCLNHYSFDPTNSAWLVSGATRTPYGGKVGQFTPVYVESTGGTWNRLLATFLSGNDSYTVRCIYSSGSSGRFRLTCRDTSNSLETQLAGTVNGVKSTITTAAGTVTVKSDKQLLSGLREIIITFVPVNPGTGVSFGFGPDSVVVGESLLLYGACVYAGTEEKPLVNTLNSSVLVAGESQVINAESFLNFYNEEEGTIFCLSSGHNNTGYIAQADAGSGNDRRLIRMDGGSGARGFSIASSVTQSAAAGVPWIAGVKKPVVMAYRSGETNYIAADGQTASFPDNSPPGIYRMWLGTGGISSTLYLNGYIERLVYFNRALPPSIMQRLTA